MTKDVLLSQKADFIVVPSFSSVDDMRKLSELLEKEPASPWPILKIANQEAVDNLGEMLPFVKGVLISRVELALCTEPAKVPMITKEIIQTCNTQAKITLVASEILASMRYNATPTRAEVSDIANAVHDGADGVVLSEDLPFGEYALRGLQLAGKAVEEAEIGISKDGLQYNWTKKQPDVSDVLEAVTYTAYRTAKRNQAKAIVCISELGNTALHLASYKPDIPIIAITRSARILNRLSMVRGVYGILLEDFPDIDHVLPLISDTLVRDSWLNTGDKIVFVSVTISSIGKAESNLFTVQTLH